MDWRELGVQGSKKKEPSLESTKKALEKLGRPHKDYKVILVGGTNGKGSTVEMISELLQENDLKVGVNKSPHLVKPNERIKHDSKDISEQDFERLVEKVKDLDLELSFFEFMTVMAFEYFSEKEVDYAVMEVGMGGRLDATNAAENETAVITNVQADHMEYLGESLEEIAEEKAGIIPEDGDLITGSSRAAIQKTCKERKCRLHEPSSPQRFNGDILYRGEVFQLPVKGSFQTENLALALKTVEVLDEIPENIRKAVSNVKCRGRMEIISEKPLTVFDGAHNPDAVERVIEEFPEDFVCVFNCVESKKAEKMIQKIEEKSKEIIFTNSGIEWAADARELQKYSERSKVVEDPLKALKAARKSAGVDGCVLVTGSLYLVGRMIKAENGD